MCSSTIVIVVIIMVILQMLGFDAFSLMGVIASVGIAYIINPDEHKKKIEVRDLSSYDIQTNDVLPAGEMDEGEVREVLGGYYYGGEKTKPQLKRQANTRQLSDIPAKLEEPMPTLYRNSKESEEDERPAVRSYEHFATEATKEKRPVERVNNGLGENLMDMDDFLGGPRQNNVQQEDNKNKTLDEAEQSNEQLNVPVVEDEPPNEPAKNQLLETDEESKTFGGKYAGGHFYHN